MEEKDIHAQISKLGETTRLAEHYETLKLISKVTTEHFKHISNIPTPKNKIKQLPHGGLSYLDEGYMRQRLNEEFPFWKWHEGSFQFLGGEWVVVSGMLEIQLVTSQFSKRYYSLGAARIQYKSGAEHIPANIIDIDKNIASANTNAFKRAINRIANIGDDVYRKIDPDLPEDVTEALREQISQIKNPTKKSLWMHNLLSGNYNLYNLAEIQDKLNRELTEQ